MSISAKLRRAPTRIVTGAFILNSGLGKLGADDDTAKALHGMAAGVYPPLEKLDSKLFLKAVGVGETALGAALLLPVVPASLAGLGLTAFSGGLLGLYWRTPGMHHDGSPRPTQQGIPLAKDVWMLGIGASLVLDELVTAAHEKRLEKTREVKQATAVTAAKAAVRAKAARKVTRGKAAEAAGGAKSATLAKAAKAAALAAAAKRAVQHAGH
ncbi:MAG: rane protein [Pseudonocardiales bacterium]|nr:rane protein [Pseudonocardiales bacterium]